MAPAERIMASPMMVLGVVKFTVSGAAFERLSRTTRYLWAQHTALGGGAIGRAGGPSHQFIGPAEDTISLDGTMYPQFNGGPMEAAFMRLAASSGTPLPLLDGSGHVFGLWLIESVTETGSAFLADGRARKIEFSLALRKYGGLA